MSIKPKMLWTWKNAGSPAKQADCTVAHSGSIRKAMNFQRLNVNRAKQLYLRVRGSYAPETIACHCEGALALEEGIYQQLRSVCKYAV